MKQRKEKEKKLVLEKSKIYRDVVLLKAVGDVFVVNEDFLWG